MIKLASSVDVFNARMYFGVNYSISWTGLRRVYRARVCFGCSEPAYLYEDSLGTSTTPAKEGGDRDT